MIIPSLQRLAVALGIFCAVLLASSGAFFCKYGWLCAEVAFADEQTQIFDEMRTKALLATDPPDIVAPLGYAVWYYPSGSKQEAGSKMDRMVERQRSAAVRDIVAHLRHTTGEDLGESPKPWIERYERK